MASQTRIGGVGIKGWREGEILRNATRGNTNKKERMKDIYFEAKEKKIK